MSDQDNPSIPESIPEATPAVRAAFTRQDAADALRQAAGQVMSIEDVTLPDRARPLRLRGCLSMPSQEAFAFLRPRFEALGFTPALKREGEQDAVYALPVVYGQGKRRIPWMAILMLLATIFSVLYIGVQGELYLPIGQIIAVRLTGNEALAAAPNLLPTDAEWQQSWITGGLYALALLGILGAHEMGHYVVARRHSVETTLPFFIPMPFNILGTFGAVIAMKEPAANRRVQFDIGIAGPLAGLIVAAPVLVIGLLLSDVTTTAEVLSSMPDGVATSIIHEGNSLAYLAAKFAVFGQVLPSGDLDVWIHPVAFAAWAGLLVTALNLFPIGQLDGGHVMYGLFGEKAGAARWPIIGVLTLMAVAGTLADMGIMDLGFGWSGWWLLILMMVFLFRQHAPVLDEITELDGKRRALGVVMLVIFILIFTPRPLVVDVEPLAALLRLLA
jgi:Zn-dependent protease